MTGASPGAYPGAPGDAAAARLARVAAISSLAVATGLLLLKLGAALLTDSVALLSLLIDSLADVGASAVTVLAVRVALQPPDRDHRYGHGKAEALSALAQGALVAGSAAFVLLAAATRLAEPEPVRGGAAAVAVTAVSLGATAALVLFQRHVVRRTGSTAIAADRLHYAGDLASNLAVLASLLLAPRTGALWLDPVVGGAIAAVMLRGAAGIARVALAQLMDRELPDPDRARVEAVVMAHPEARGLHDLRSRRAAGTRFLEFHLELDGAMTLRDAHAVTEAVERELEAAFPDAEVTIHQEPAGLADARRDHRLASGGGGEASDPGLKP